jgi:hypothetical protein
MSALLRPVTGSPRRRVAVVALTPVLATYVPHRGVRPEVGCTPD